MQIAYQGEPGAYSEAAALRYRPDATPVACETFDAVFEAVVTGRVAEGVLPIENSVGGTIHRNYDLLLEHDLPIVGEVQLRVEHNLLAYPGATLDGITQIFSHPQALAQCERFLRSLSGRRVVATYDTAGSAKLIRDARQVDAAAIASARAAEVFGLAILKTGVQDFPDNITRFLLIGPAADPPVRADKTTVVFSVPNEPGALFKALSVFALRGIDLTKLESRPLRGRPWEYLFYADLSMHREELRATRALGHLAEFASSLRCLGSYPAWREPLAAEPNAPESTSEPLSVEP